MLLDPSFVPRGIVSALRLNVNALYVELGKNIVLISVFRANKGFHELYKTVELSNPLLSSAFLILPASPHDAEDPT